MPTMKYQELKKKNDDTGLYARACEAMVPNIEEFEPIVDNDIGPDARACEALVPDIDDLEPIIDGEIGPYARAREAAEPDMPGDDLLNFDVYQLRHFVGKLKKLDHRCRWRRLAARRNSFLALALQGVERALGKYYAGREKKDGTWTIFGVDYDGAKVPVARVTIPKPKNWKEAREGIDIVVIRAWLLDLEGLGAWREQINGTWGTGRMKGTRNGEKKGTRNG
jgi:hypothetical protein